MASSLSFDLNALAAGALRDMASLQESPHGQRAYTRAATAVLGLAEPLRDLQRADGSLPKMPHLGPSSAKVVLEVLATGRSATVEQRIADRGAGAEIARLRADRGGFLSRAAAREILALPGNDLSSRYHGDLQMHSTWSDGRESVQAMAEGCLARGYRFAAMTDHSGGLAIAGGLSPERLRAQALEIAAVNARLAGRFQVLAGVEANIGADGSLDVDAEARRALDLVVAAPHSALRAARPQTERMVAAVSAAGVHVLGHPRGRKYGARAGVAADWPRVFAAAADHGVAIEIDGDPSRQDVDCTLAVDALAAGCLFALDSDAHGVDELWYVEMALAHARLAQIPAERIVNCWPLDRFHAWREARWRGASGEIPRRR